MTSEATPLGNAESQRSAGAAVTAIATLDRAPVNDVVEPDPIAEDLGDGSAPQPVGANGRRGLFTTMASARPTDVLDKAPAMAPLAWEVAACAAAIGVLALHGTAPHAPWLWTGAAAASLLAMASTPPRVRTEWIVAVASGVLVVGGLLRATAGGLLAGTAAALLAAIALQAWPPRALVAVPTLAWSAFVLHAGKGLPETLTAGGRIGYAVLILAGGSLVLGAADPEVKGPLGAVLLGPGLLLLAVGSANASRPMVVAWALAIVCAALSAGGRPVVGTGLLVGAGAALADAPHALPLALGVVAAVACSHWIDVPNDRRVQGFLLPGIASLAAFLGPATSAPVWLGWAAGIVVSPRLEHPSHWRLLVRPGAALLLIATVVLVAGPGRLIPHAGG